MKLLKLFYALNCAISLSYCAESTKIILTPPAHAIAPYSEERRQELVREIEAIPTCNKTGCCTSTFTNKMNELFFKEGPWDKTTKGDLSCQLCLYQNGCRCKHPWKYTTATLIAGFLATGGIFSTLAFQQSVGATIGISVGGTCCCITTCCVCMCSPGPCSESKVPDDMNALDFLSQPKNWPLITEESKPIKPAKSSKRLYGSSRSAINDYSDGDFSGPDHCHSGGDCHDHDFDHGYES